MVLPFTIRLIQPEPVIQRTFSLFHDLPYISLVLLTEHELAIGVHGIVVDSLFN